MHFSLIPILSHSWIYHWASGFFSGRCCELQLNWSKIFMNFQCLFDAPSSNTSSILTVLTWQLDNKLVLKTIAVILHWYLKKSITIQRKSDCRGVHIESHNLCCCHLKTNGISESGNFQPERVGSSESEYGIRADVWSLGITLVELSTGRHPYEGCSTDFELLAKINNDPAPRLEPSELYSKNFCAFIAKCLMKRSLDRPNYDELLVNYSCSNDFLLH